MIGKVAKVKNYILHNIDSHIYGEGQVIASENVLAKNLRVSRTTVRIALQELVDKGILYREMGRGTFVSAQPKYAEFRWGCGFTKEANRLGLHPSSKDATIELRHATKEEAAVLKIKTGEKIWFVTRIRCLNNVPFLYSEEYFIYNQCPNLNETIINGSIYSYLESQGIRLGFTDQTMSAAISPKYVTKKLHIPANSPLILVEGNCCLKNGFPFNTGKIYYRTDIYKITQSVKII